MAEKEHSLTMNGRRDMSLTGITDVKEFSENKVILKTQMGDMCIRGEKLTISRLDTDTGILSVKGEINMIKYSSPAGGGIIEGLFK